MPNRAVQINLGRAAFAGCVLACSIAHAREMVTCSIPVGARVVPGYVIANGTGHVELRTRIDSGETELVLVPADGSEPLWLTRTTDPQQT